MTGSDEYEKGKRDAQLEEHDKRISSLESEMKIQVRITYGLLAIMSFISFWPKIEAFIK